MELDKKEAGIKSKNMLFLLLLLLCESDKFLKIIDLNKSEAFNSELNQ